MSLSSIFQDIADAIRSKTGKSESIYPVDMASEIEGISSGGDYKLEKMPSGAVSSFNDGTDLPLNKLKVSIEPVQDLHGYDAPWVGGAGKNKYPDTQDINLGGTNPRTVDNVISVPIGAGTYVISWKTTGEATPYLQIRVDGVHTNLYSGSSFTVTSSANKCYWYITTADYDANKTAHIYDIQIESGSASTTYEPYSNICPISGWDEAVVTRCGKNFAKPYSRTSGIVFYEGNGNITVNGTASDTLYIPTTSQAISEGILFTLKAGTYIPSLSNPYPNNNIFVNVVSKDNVNLSQGNVFTITEDTEVYFRVVVKAGTYNNWTSGLMIEAGSTATTYEPYNGQTYTTDLDGTRYGGKLDVVSGVLTVTNANIVSYNGEIINEPWISSMDVYSAGATPTIGAQVVYPLATPQTIQLTPTAVRSLIELNNIWADTGDIINGEYFKGAGTQPTS